MTVEKSAGAVIFRKEGERCLFLLLRYPFGSRTPKVYWDLSKGHIEKGEKLEDTVKREVREETGLKDVNFINGFRETIKYFFQWGGNDIMKFVTFFLIETKTEKITISEEHIGYKWLPYQGAIKTLTFDNAREILKKANALLSGKSL
jgi:8-oxo-dGTP pyrophosphatase MutT (NUDIX family)